MPSLAKYKYTRHTRKLDKILREAPNVGRPKKVSEAWLRSGYDINNNEEFMISVLRAIGLIRPDGSPTDLWNTIQDPTPENKIRFADAVREAYGELFTHYPRAHRLDDETLRTFFQGQEIGGAEVQRAVLRTFKTLIKYGDFDTDPKSPTYNAIELPELMRSVDTLNQHIHDWFKTHNKLRAQMTALDPMRSRLESLTLDNKDALRDSILAAEAGLFGASHGWHGLVLAKSYTNLLRSIIS
jgi:hypothetical protein